MLVGFTNNMVIDAMKALTLVDGDWLGPRDVAREIAAGPITFGESMRVCDRLRELSRDGKIVAKVLVPDGPTMYSLPPSG